MTIEQIKKNQNLKGVIHWGKREKAGERRDAYYDYVIYTVPFSGTYDQMAIRSAVATRIMLKGVSGNLIHGGRGYTFTGLDPARPNHILIEHAYAIGD